MLQPDNTPQKENIQNIVRTLRREKELVTQFLIDGFSWIKNKEAFKNFADNALFIIRSGWSPINVLFLEKYVSCGIKRKMPITDLNDPLRDLLNGCLSHVKGFDLDCLHFCFFYEVSPIFEDVDEDNLNALFAVRLESLTPNQVTADL